MRAAIFNNTKTVEQLIYFGANLDAAYEECNTTLLFAAKKDHISSSQCGKCRIFYLYANIVFYRGAYC